MKARRLCAVFCLLFLSALTASTEPKPSGHPGLFPAPNKEGKWGFIDATGRYRIPPQFDGANEFSDGVAYIWEWNHWDKKVGIVDTHGTVTWFPPQEYEFTFHDGLACVQSYGDDKGKYGFIDKTGHLAISPQFFYAGEFSEGLAWVYVDGPKARGYGFIDKTGKFVIQPQFTHQPGNFVEGLAKIDLDGKIGFIDRKGSFRVPAKFQQTDESFSEGMVAAVPIDGRPRGVYIDIAGEVVFEIPLWKERTGRQMKQSVTGWQMAAPFSAGLAPFMSYNKIGFVDKAGAPVIQPEFRGAKSFSEGLAPVRIINNTGIYLWGYCDHTGKLVIEPQFLDAEPFEGGLAHVTTVEGSRLLIDKTGKTIWVLIK